jgi:hypothetical protein
MPSTYSPLLRTELLATGEQAGTWGIAVNTIHGTILEAAIAGTATIVLPAGTADYSLTALNGVADEARSAVLNITATITANRNVICPSLSKQYLVYNATSGAFTVTLKTLAGTGVVLPQGAYTLVYCDGTNVIGVDNIAAVHNATTKATAVDADEVGYWDSVTGLIRKMTWANIKTVLKAYFDALYVSKTSTTGSAIIPAGTTAQRDGTPADGYTRYNTNIVGLESWYSSAWNAIATTNQLFGFRNKIINGNFTYPVNQKSSATRVTTTSAYNFDQWYYGSDSKLYQPVEYINLLPSQVYTLSWSGTATAEYKFATVGSSGIVADAGAWTSIVSGGTMTTPSDLISGLKFVWLRWTGVTSALSTFDLPQLEMGTLKTTFEYKFYDQVLRECQRYLPVIQPNAGSYCGAYAGQCFSGSQVNIGVPLQVPTRTAITGLIFSGNYSVFTASGTGINGGSALSISTTSTNYNVNMIGNGLSGLVAGDATLLYSLTTILIFTGAQI